MKKLSLFYILTLVPIVFSWCGLCTSFMFISSLYDSLIIRLKLIIGWFGQQVAYYTVLSACALMSWEGSAITFVRISDVQWCYSMRANVAFVIWRWSSLLYHHIILFYCKCKCIHTSGTFSSLWNAGKLKTYIMSLKTFLYLFLKSLIALPKDS